MAHTGTNDKSQTAAYMPGIFRITWLALLIAVATFIRVHDADHFHYSTDEAMHVRMAEGGSVSEVWRFSHYETHPPLGNILRYFWMKLSQDEGFVRGESLLFGLALILLYYRIGRRLGGESAGIACAALVAFSHGCIIQSYVVRNYIFLVFFLSLGFYAYLRWRSTRSVAVLAAYVFCGWLAALTHFSAIFCIACIALFEAICMLLAKTPRRTQAPWILANIAIWLVAVTLYQWWQPILVPIRAYFFTLRPRSAGEVLHNTLSYPQITASYIYPDSGAAAVILAAMIACAICPKLASIKQYSPRPFLALAAVGFFCGMALVFSGAYSTPGTRYCLWLLPLIVPPAGLAIAGLGEGALKKLLPTWGKFSSMIFAIFLLIVGIALYDLNARFSDGSEYAMPQEQWEDLNRYLATLGPGDLVVTEKDDAIMLANLYPVMGDDAFTGDKMATLIPFANTHILFNPYYPRHYNKDIFIATMKDAEARHILDGISRLVFLELAWSRSPQADLMLCDALAAKQLLAFPPLPEGRALTREDIYHTRSAFLLLPTQDFLTDVLAPAGKAHGCMDGRHDMVPGLVPKHP